MFDSHVDRQKYEQSCTFLSLNFFSRRPTQRLALSTISSLHTSRLRLGKERGRGGETGEGLCLLYSGRPLFSLKGPVDHWSHLESPSSGQKKCFGEKRTSHSPCQREFQNYRTRWSKGTEEGEKFPNPHIELTCISSSPCSYPPTPN